MKDRIIRFLSSENKTSAQFAEEIGVQPSGVSHILSGRNNPSLDFVLKMLTRYSYLSPEWLLFGKEPMFRSVAHPTLFDNIPDSPASVEKEVEEGYKDRDRPMTDYMNEELPSGSSVPEDIPQVKPASTGSRIPDRIIFFYRDKSFEEYRPG